MTDQESTPAEGQEPKAPEAKEGQEPQGQPETFPREVVESLRSEAAQRRIEVQQLKEQLEERDERDKTEIEKALSKATKAEQAKAAAETALLRYQVAAEKQIPGEALELLNGNTREELEASADKILSLVKSRTENNDTPNFDGGAREPAPDTDPTKAHDAAVLKLLGIGPST
jgi:hypothetical protein